MALIDCPDCGRQISDAAPACIGCGRPMSPGVPASGPSPAMTSIPADVPLSGFACPKCGGDLVAFRALHEKGAGRAPSYVAPPDRSSIHPENGCGFIFGGAAILAVLTWFVSSFPLAIGAFVIGSFILARVAHARAQPEIEERHRAALARWDARHLCTRCGATVARTANGSLEVEDADAEIDALLRAGQKIQAIKVMRERTGLGLKEAKDAVEAREARM